MNILALPTIFPLPLLLTAIGILLPTESKACTCAVPPLAERYERAAVVLVATVGKRSDGLDGFGNRIAEWSFDINEVLKGDVTFDALIPAGCGWGATPGEKYLVFTDESGAVSSCTSGRLSENDRYRADLEVLRQHKNGDLQTLSEPLVFSTGTGTCHLALEMSIGHGRLYFEYRFADVEVRDFDDQQFRYDNTQQRRITLEGAGPHPAYFAGFKRLRVWYPHSRHKIDGSGRVLIGDKEWSTGYPDMEAPFLRFEVVADAAIDEVLTALEFHNNVHISAEYRDFPLSRKNYPDFPRIEGMAPHFYRGTAVDEFRRCMDGV